MATRNTGLAALGDVFHGVANQITESRLHRRALEDEERLHGRAREERAADLADVRSYTEGRTQDQRGYDDKVFERNRNAAIMDLLRLEQGLSPDAVWGSEEMMAALNRNGPEYKRRLVDLSAIKAQADALILQLPGKSELAANLAAVKHMSVEQLEQARERVGLGLREANKVLGEKEGDKTKDQEAAAKQVADALTESAAAGRRFSEVAQEYEELGALKLNAKQEAQALARATGADPELAERIKKHKLGGQPKDKAAWTALLSNARQEVAQLAQMQMAPLFKAAERAAQQADKRLNDARDAQRNPAGARFLPAAMAAQPPAGWTGNERAVAAPIVPPSEADKQAAAAKALAKSKAAAASALGTQPSVPGEAAVNLYDWATQMPPQGRAPAGANLWMGGGGQIPPPTPQAPVIEPAPRSMGDVAALPPRITPTLVIPPAIGMPPAPVLEIPPRPITPTLEIPPAIASGPAPTLTIPTRPAPVLRLDEPVITPAPLSAREAEDRILNNPATMYSSQAALIRKQRGYAPLMDVRALNGP